MISIQACCSNVLKDERRQRVYWLVVRCGIELTFRGCIEFLAAPVRFEVLEPDLVTKI